MNSFFLNNFDSLKINGKYEKYKEVKVNDEVIQKNDLSDVFMYKLEDRQVFGPILGYTRYQLYTTRLSDHINDIFDNKEWFQLKNGSFEPCKNGTIDSTDKNEEKQCHSFVLKSSYDNLIGKQELVEEKDSQSSYQQCESKKTQIYWSKNEWILAPGLNSGNAYQKFEKIPFVGKMNDFSLQILDKDCTDEDYVFPEKIGVTCPQSNIEGCQTIATHMPKCGNFPVYQSAQTKIQLQQNIFVEEWHFGPEIDSDQQFKEFDAFPIDQEAQVFIITCLDIDTLMNDGLFRDPTFKPDNESIGARVLKEAPDIKGIQWFRASKLHKNPVLFENIEPNDVAQGKIGNCWLMAALSAMAEFPALIKNVTFKDSPEFNPYCEQTVYLQDQMEKEMKPITVSDMIPCEEEDFWIKPSPLFAQAKGEEIWVNLVEKGFAKFVGSQGSLICGSIIKGLIAMTGCEHNIIWQLKEDTAVCYYQDIEFDRTYQTPKGKFFEGGWCFWGQPAWNAKEGDQASEDTVSFDKLFDLMCEQDENNQVIGVSRKLPTDESIGIIGGHAQSVITLIDRDGHRLVQLRNPWGQQEWSGKWSDADLASWDANPQMKADLWSNEDDGLFFMPFQDFCKQFTDIEVLQKNMNEQGISKGKEKMLKK